MLKTLGNLSIEKQDTVNTLVNILEDEKTSEQGEVIQRILGNQEDAKECLEFLEKRKQNAQMAEQHEPIMPPINIFDEPERKDPEPEEFFAQYNIQNDSQLESVL